jgi:hypothetical protein
MQQMTINKKIEKVTSDLSSIFNWMLVGSMLFRLNHKDSDVDIMVYLKEGVSAEQLNDLIFKYRATSHTRPYIRGGRFTYEFVYSGTNFQITLVDKESFWEIQKDNLKVQKLLEEELFPNMFVRCDLIELKAVAPKGFGSVFFREVLWFINNRNHLNLRIYEISNIVGLGMQYRNPNYRVEVSKLFDLLYYNTK